MQSPDHAPAKVGHLEQRRGRCRSSRPCDGVLKNLLNKSGLTNVNTKTVRALLKLPSTSQALEMMQQAFGAYRAVVADLGEAERSKAWLEVRECLKQFENDDGFKTEFEFIIGSGARK